jgi:nicotinate-nucleotide pyrophosphorylase
MIEVSEENERDYWEEIDNDRDHLTYTNNAPFGDVMSEKAAADTRVYFTNLNGFTLDAKGGTWSQVIQTMAQTQVDIVGFTELNKDTTRYDIRTQMAQVCDRQFNSHKTVWEQYPGNA